MVGIKSLHKHTAFIRHANGRTQLNARSAAYSWRATSVRLKHYRHQSLDSGRHCLQGGCAPFIGCEIVSLPSGKVKGSTRKLRAVVKSLHLRRSPQPPSHERIKPSRPFFSPLAVLLMGEGRLL